MRKSILLLAVAIAAGPLALAAPPAGSHVYEMGKVPAAAPVTYKRLDDQDALAKLQRENPRHYAIARRILAAATEICDASKGELISTRFDVEYVVCAQSFWLTSLPPKRALQFRIDDTVYSALVTAARIVGPVDPKMPLHASPP